MDKWEITFSIKSTARLILKYFSHKKKSFRCFMWTGRFFYSLLSFRVCLLSFLAVIQFTWETAFNVNESTPLFLNSLTDVLPFWSQSCLVLIKTSSFKFLSYKKVDIFISKMVSIHVQCFHLFTVNFISHFYGFGFSTFVLFVCLFSSEFYGNARTKFRLFCFF